jgi:hypothetical protein
MPVWKSARRALLALLAASIPAALADFRVAELTPRLADGALVLNGSLQLELTRKVEEAVSKGIELPLVIEARLYRKRTFWWDERIDGWTLRRSLRYHALSGQYIVGYGNTYESHLASADALKQLGTFADLRLPLSDPGAAGGAGYLLRLRVQIDIEALPAPLRPVAYTTLAWHLNSGWTTWTVAP